MKIKNNHKPSELKSPALQLDKFVRHIEALISSLPGIIRSLSDEFTKCADQYEAFLKAKGKQKKKNRKTTYLFRGKDITEIRHLRKETDKAFLSARSVPEIYFISLVSRFETFIADLLRELISLRPEVMSTTTHQFTLVELMDMKTIEQARNQIIEDKLDSVLREPYDKLFRWMEQTFSTELKAQISSWSKFVEIIQRRHLLVHNDGKISTRYIENCLKNGVPDTNKLTKGNRLSVDPDYFKESYRCLFEVAVKVTHLLWRNLRPDQLALSDDNLIKLTFELLTKEHNHLASKLLDFACLDLKTHSNDESKRILAINRAQAYKWRGKSKECKAILDKVDWSACGLRFQIAVAVLRDDFLAATKLMLDVAKTKAMDEHEYGYWPLFKEFRKSPLFHQMFQKVYRHPYSIEEKSQPTPGPELPGA